MDITWWDTIHNWIFAFLGNLVGAVIFVAGAYWFVWAGGGDEAEEPEPQPAGVIASDQPEEEHARPTHAPA